MKRRAGKVLLDGELVGKIEEIDDQTSLVYVPEWLQRKYKASFASIRLGKHTPGPSRGRQAGTSNRWTRQELHSKKVARFC